MRSSAVRLALAVLLTIMSGCTVATQGQSTRERPSVPTSAASGSSSGAASPSRTENQSGVSGPTIAVPPRPRELTLKEIEPCRLLTPTQLDQLKVDREPQSRTSGDSYKAPSCLLRVVQEPSHTYGLRLITNEDMGQWLTGDRNVDAWLVTVGGFPAAQFKTLGTDGADCATSVGVAQDQQLMIDILQSAARELTQDQLCQMTQHAAELAMQTLQTL